MHRGDAGPRPQVALGGAYGMEMLQQVFEGHEIRAVEREGEFWFVASDVAKLLGYRDAANMIRRLDEDEKGTR